MPHANVTARCDPLPCFEGRTSDDLISGYLDLAARYRECSERHAGLVESLNNP